MTLTPAGVVPAGVATGRVRAGEAAGEAEAAARLAHVTRGADGSRRVCEVSEVTRNDGTVDVLELWRG